MDMTLIQGTISGLKLAGDIAKGILELKSLTDVQGKVIELQSAILSAQSSALSANSDQAAMVEDIRALKKEIADVKAWESQKQRYKLVSPLTGVSAYAIQKSMSNGEAAHYLCANCFQNGKKSFLAQTGNKEGWVALVCSACKFTAQTRYRALSGPKYAEEVTTE